MEEGFIERVSWQGGELAIILRREFSTDGIRFLTPEHYSQQLGYMKRPAGYVIPPHVHHVSYREVHYTKEVLLIRRGLVRVDFYSEQGEFVRDALLRTGDVILLAYGGHGFEVLEEAEIIEVKQGPYLREGDKQYFSPEHDR